MKKILLSLFTVFTFSQLCAQLTMLVNIKTTGTSLPLNASVIPNATIYATSLPEDEVKIEFDIMNTSGSTQSYNVRRYDLLLNGVSSSTDQASAYFCLAGSCYGNATFVSPSPLVLNAGQAASSISGQFQMLATDLKEPKQTVGLNIVRYTVRNASTVSDSLQFTIRYSDPNAPVGLRSINKQAANFQLSPNPSSNMVEVKFLSQKGQTQKMSVINSLGELIYTRHLSHEDFSNKLTLDVSDFSAGIYFVKLEGDGVTAVTRKLIVE